MHKYNAVKTTIDGITFDSKAESRRFTELNLLQQAGEICGLRVHVPYEIRVNNQLICKYIADFVYYEGAEIQYGREIVEDVKGVRTAAFNLKARLMKAVHGIDIRIWSG